MSSQKIKHTKQYLSNKTSLVGSHCICPACDAKFTKGSYQQVFCKTKWGTICKDKYWNTVDPKKQNNTTRISPASRAWLNSREEYYQYDDDPSWDAHKNSF